MSASTTSSSAELPKPILVAVEILEGLLKRSGVQAQVTVELRLRDVILQIETKEEQPKVCSFLRKRLADYQYLVNRLLHKEYPTVPRVRLDLGHQLEAEQEEFLQTIQATIQQVAETGNPCQLEPLNSYYRRLVHNLIAVDDRVSSWSPPSSDRLKQITIMPVKNS